MTSTDAKKPASSVSIDVVVVGAGLSGLQAALRIHQANYSCVVVEARSEVGGKTKTVLSRPTGSGLNDVGAAWINDSNQSEIYKLFQRYKLQGEIQRATGKVIHQISEDGYVALPYGESPLPKDEQLALYGLISHLNDQVSQSFLRDPEKGPGADELDSVTFKDYCFQQLPTIVGSSFANLVTRALLGVESHEVSALFMINYFKSGTGIENLLSDTKHGGQYIRARQGTQAISKGMASELPQGSVLLNSAVTEISQSSSGSCVVTTGDGRLLYCRKVIVSVPTAILNDIKFSPPLPEGKQHLSTSTKLGYYSKTIYVFDTPWWQEAGLSGAFDCEAGSGPSSFSRDTSIPDDDQWSISCFIVGEPGRQWSRLSAESRAQVMWKQFIDIFGSVVDHIPTPVNTIEQEWSKEAFIWGAPSPVMGPGVLTSVGSLLRHSVGNVHFVGTEYSYIWKGYMEGAIRSGQAGAEEVLTALQAEGSGKGSLSRI